MKRYSKDEVDFESPAKGKDRCRDCRHFEPPEACEIVYGRIQPGDWCDQFKRKVGLATAFERAQ